MVAFILCMLFYILRVFYNALYSFRIRRKVGLICYLIYNMYRVPSLLCASLLGVGDVKLND